MSANEANIKNFNDDLQKFIVATGVTVDKGVRTIAMRLYNGITQMTPVDTGRAKGNWNMGIGQPDLSIDEGARQKQNFNLKIGDGLKTIYITNNFIIRFINQVFMRVTMISYMNKFFLRNFFNLLPSHISITSNFTSIYK